MSGPTRNLAAILAADVADYSTLVARDETRMLAALRALRNDVLAPCVAAHRGRIVKSMGDGWLMEFASIADAIRCAIAVQGKLESDDLVALRMGIHIGDIVHEDEDIYGDGVNIAARLQQIAQPGGVMISDMARRSVDEVLGAEFIKLGARRLKHIRSAVIVHGWRGGALEASRPETGSRQVWSDAEILIVALARTGDRNAFGELVKRRQSWIRNLMRRACGDATLADDLAQQVFLQAWRTISQLQRPERFDGWLRRLAVNVWLAHLRRTDPLKDAEEVGEPAMGAPAASPDIAIDLDQALAALPAAMRLAVVLAYHEGMTHTEIAEATGSPLGTVKSHIQRGTARLRQILADHATEQQHER